MAGYFLIYRDFERNPVFRKGPFCEPMAWVWLIGRAMFKAGKVRVGEQVISLERGQLVASSRYLRDAWGWKEPRTRRFIKRLKIDAMIDASTDAGITILTIRNYDAYQVADGAGDAPNDAPNDAEATQGRRKEERRNKTKNKLSLGKEPAEGKKRAYEEDPAFPDFWAIYPPRLGGSDRKPAAVWFTRHVRNGVDPLEIIQGTRGYAVACNREGKTGTKFVKTAEVFLSKESWRTYLDQSNVVQLDAWRTDPSAWTDPHNPPPWPDAPPGVKAGSWLRTSTAWVKAR